MIKTDKVLWIPMPLLIVPVASLIYLWFIIPVTPSVSNMNQKKDVVNSAGKQILCSCMSDVSEIIRGGSGPCCCYNFSPCEPGFAAACRGTSVWRKQQTHGALMTVNKQIWINWFNLHRDDDGSRYPGYKHTTSPSRWVQEISWQPYIGEQTCWVTLVYLLVPSIARFWAETVI